MTSGNIAITGFICGAGHFGAMQSRGRAVGRGVEIECADRTISIMGLTEDEAKILAKSVRDPVTLILCVNGAADRPALHEYAGNAQTFSPPDPPSLEEIAATEVMPHDRRCECGQCPSRDSDEFNPLRWSG